MGEIISRVERRRKRTAEQKVKILIEVLDPKATASAVADRNGISRSPLYAWKALAQQRDIPGIRLNEQKPLFAPVRIETMPAVPASTIAAAVASTFNLSVDQVRLRSRSQMDASYGLRKALTRQPPCCGAG